MQTVLNGFDEFWEIYPRHVGKQAAIRMYARALKLTTPEAILFAAKRYACERAGQDQQYTKHPATWLNAGCWNDYEMTPKSNAEGASAGDRSGLTYVSFSEREAWDTYGRSIGKSYPRDRSGGWWFPTRWPPGFEASFAAKRAKEPGAAA